MNNKGFCVGCTHTHTHTHTNNAHAHSPGMKEKSHTGSMQNNKDSAVITPVSVLQKEKVVHGNRRTEQTASHSPKLPGNLYLSSTTPVDSDILGGNDTMIVQREKGGTIKSQHNAQSKAAIVKSVYGYPDLSFSSISIIRHGKLIIFITFLVCIK